MLERVLDDDELVDGEHEQVEDGLQVEHLGYQVAPRLNLKHYVGAWRPIMFYDCYGI